MTVDRDFTALADSALQDLAQHLRLAGGQLTWRAVAGALAAQGMSAFVVPAGFGEALARGALWAQEVRGEVSVFLAGIGLYAVLIPVEALRGGREEQARRVVKIIARWMERLLPTYRISIAVEDRAPAGPAGEGGAQVLRLVPRK